MIQFRVQIKIDDDDDDDNNDETVGSGEAMAAGRGRGGGVVRWGLVGCVIEKFTCSNSLTFSLAFECRPSRLES